MKIGKSKVEGFFAGIFYRPFSYKITKAIVKWPITPNEITWISFFLMVIAGFLISSINRVNLIIAGFLIIIAYLLDNVDGNLARERGIVSEGGIWLDSTLDRGGEIVLFLALTVALYKQTGDVSSWVLGFIAISGMLMTYCLLTLIRISFGKDTLSQAGAGFFSKLEKIGIKKNFFIYGVDLHLTIIAIGLMLNQVIVVLWFFAIVQNLYWIIIFVNTYLRKIN